MFNTPILDIPISIIFIFVLYSLLATSLKEGIATVMGMRARMLAKGIVQMLDNDRKELRILGFNLRKIWKKIVRFVKSSLNFLYSDWCKNIATPEKNIDALFYQHMLIKNYGESALFSKPSYISQETFSKVILDLIQEHSVDKSESLENQIKASPILDEKTRKLFYGFAVEAGYDTPRFRLQLEAWFNASMDRVSGWYKRQVQFILFMIGLGLGISFNVDIVTISNNIAHNSTLQTTLANSAQKYQQSDLTQAANNVSDLNSVLGLGWTFTAKDSCSCFDPKAEVTNKATNGNTNSFEEIKNNVIYVLHCSFFTIKFASFLVFALGISFGAPFWFDLLNSFTNIRGSGNKTNDDVKTSLSQQNSTAPIVINQNSGPEPIG